MRVKLVSSKVTSIGIQGEPLHTEPDVKRKPHLHKYVMVLLCVTLRWLLSPPADHSDHECQSQGVRSCGECLAAGPLCAWCAEEVSDLGNTLLLLRLRRDHC